MEVKLSIEMLYQAVCEQRNALIDNEARLLAGMKMLAAENAELKKQLEAQAPPS